MDRLSLPWNFHFFSVPRIIKPCQSSGNHGNKNRAPLKRGGSGEPETYEGEEMIGLPPCTEDKPPADQRRGFAVKCWSHGLCLSTPRKFTLNCFITLQAQGCLLGRKLCNHSNCVRQINFRKRDKLDPGEATQMGKLETARNLVLWDCVPSSHRSGLSRKTAETGRWGGGNRVCPYLYGPKQGCG